MFFADIFITAFVS